MRSELAAASLKYSIALSQRTSLLSAPILCPKCCSGDGSEAAATATVVQSARKRASRRARARIMVPPEPTNIMQSVKFQSRMDAVQAPIVQVIGDLIRQVPGTISLGQGVVHYGPPRQAIDAARECLGDPATHEYQDGTGIPILVERLTRKLKHENGIDVGRGRRLMVTAGANMAFVHVVLAI